MTRSPVRRARPRAYTGDQSAERAIFAATERLLVDQPIHEISVAAIIGEAGLSRASFYHYFGSKFDVVAALMGRIFDDIFSATHVALETEWEGSGRALRASLRTALDTWSAHREVIHAVLENQHAVPALHDVWTAVSNRFAALLAGQIAAERAAGHAPDGLDADAIATMLVCGAERIFYVGSTGLDERFATADEQLDAIVAVALAAIYGPVAA